MLKVENDSFRGCSNRWKENAKCLIVMEKFCSEANKLVFSNFSIYEYNSIVKIKIITIDLIAYHFCKHLLLLPCSWQLLEIAAIDKKSFCELYKDFEQISCVQKVSKRNVTAETDFKWLKVFFFGTFCSLSALQAGSAFPYLSMLSSSFVWCLKLWKSRHILK